MGYKLIGESSYSFFSPHQSSTEGLVIGTLSSPSSLLPKEQIPHSAVEELG